MAQATISTPASATRIPPARTRYGLLLGREVLLLTLGLLGYRMARTWVNDEIPEALDNAARVIDWERAIGIFTEVDLQSTVLGNDALIWFLNRYYFIGHFLGATMLMVWLYVFHWERYGRVRRVLFTVTITGLVLHVAFPLAPPRWFPQMGFVDTLQTYGPKVYDTAVADTANQIAAMPSLHVGWALIAAWAVVTASHSRWRWFAIAHPVTTTLGVVLTANHWWLDAVVAMLLVYAAILADRPVQRWLEARQARRDAQRLGAREEAEAEDELAIAAG